MDHSMKLSEAILKGCEIAPIKTTNVFLRQEGPEDPLQACVWGAAIVGSLPDNIELTGAAIINYRNRGGLKRALNGRLKRAWRDPKPADQELREWAIDRLGEGYSSAITFVPTYSALMIALNDETETSREEIAEALAEVGL